VSTATAAIPAETRAGRFAAFSFVDGITAFASGRRAEGWYLVPSSLAEFPTSLVGEAIGQLAAWTAMAGLDFRTRPLAGLARETLIRGDAIPGRVLELAVELESLAADAVVYDGWARVDGVPIVELRQSIGAMLPTEHFDDPEELRRDLDLLLGPGAPPGRLTDLPVLDTTLEECEPGHSMRTTLHVPDWAPFFADHFPRKPILPGTLLLGTQLRLALELARDLVEPPPGFRLAVSRVMDMKLRRIVPPGKVATLALTVQGHTAGSALLTLDASLGHKPAGSARAEVTLRGAP
jgi:3-hydroxymyristoyl/3-hydroxydecanoyl-(acyl carrier protein) dehydratase